MSEITKELTIIDRVKIFERDGKQWTTSLNIAEVFGKNHFDVLDKIEKLECSQEFAQRNFTAGGYADKNNQMRKLMRPRTPRTHLASIMRLTGTRGH